MTSSACQLGELTTLGAASATDGSVAPQVLPSEAWQIVENEQFDAGLVNVADDKSELTQQQQQPVAVATCDRYQARSGSSDSGQLSLLSSFGSISFGGYQLDSHHQYNTNPSSDSTSHQSISVDFDQHQFYCSLMLLNSLDFCHYEQLKTNTKNSNLKEQNLDCQSSNTPSLTLSQVELNTNLDSAPSYLAHNRSLQDCRPNSISSDKAKLDNTPSEVKDSRRAPNRSGDHATGGLDKNSGAKKGSGLGSNFLGGGNWREHGAGKLVAAATNSSGFVDKLLMHMINKRNGRSSNQMSGVKQTNKGASKHQDTSRMNKGQVESANKESGSCACSRGSKDPIAIGEQPKKQKTTQSTGGIHLLSHLSRRLARRCGVKTKAVQFGESGGGGGGGESKRSESNADDVLGDDGNGAQTTNESASGLNSFKRNDANCEKCVQAQRRLELATCRGAVAGIAQLQTSGQSSASSKQSQQASRDEYTTSGAESNSNQIKPHLSETQQALKVNTTGSVGHQSQFQVQHTQSKDSETATASATTCCNDGNNRTSISNVNGNFMGIRNNLNASNSTLNTTPSNCCYCDIETCSSSGFVSSSTTNLGGRLSGIGKGSDSIIGFGCTATVGHVGGGNCGDSTTTTHSCNSSAYNEPIVTPPSPPPPTSCCSSCAAGCSHGQNTKGCDVTSLTSPDNRQATCGNQFSISFGENNKSIQGQQQLRDHHQSDATMATVSPINLATSIDTDQPKPTSVGPSDDVTKDQEGLAIAGKHPKTEIQVSTVEDEIGCDNGKYHSGLGLEKSNHIQGSKQHSSDKTKDSHLKPKPSLLTRARNSTINLASLATVTNRFSSASVGNLWHGAGSHHHDRGNYTAGELAVDSSNDGIQPIDYVARGPFDSYQEGDSQHLSPTVNLDPKSTKSASSNRLLSVAGPSRKVSTKEKCKRQKDAERVEKLRLLVNYLKSGSSQPVVSPVALEADEIELAERYKMHVILRDDILQDIQGASDGTQRPQETSDQSVESKSTTNSAYEHKSSEMNPIKTNNSSLINHSTGGTSASTPASSSSTSSMNHAHHSVHDGRSILRIGDVTWVLRHSISDPGNNFEHSPAFSTASSSPSTKEHKHHLHHHMPHHHHRHHSTHDGHHSPKQEHPQEHMHHQPQESDLCSCAPSGSYSGSSLSNYCLASGSNSNKSGFVGTQQQQPTSNLSQPSPKMFYIDDMDMIPVFSSSCLLNAASASATPPLAQAPMSQQQTSTPLTTANSTNCCSQPSTPVIYTNFTTSINNNNNNEGTCGDSLSSSNRNASTSAWTNPQNLATWIDNEVNSLVHDLEAKSQQLQTKNEAKHSKSGKKKWLSVTSSHSSRRSSSGAQST